MRALARWARSSQLPACLLVLASLLAGCASTPGPTRELLDARSALERARKSALARLAREELQEAAIALAQAEEAQRQSPGGPWARDSAYIAARLAERARVAAIVAADRETLASAELSLERLRANLDRRTQDARVRAERLEQAKRTRRIERQTLEDELEKAKGYRAELERQGEGTITLRVSTRRIFVENEALLLPQGRLRLKRIAAALLAGPPARVQIVVVDNEIGRTPGAERLTRLRAARIRQALENEGIPSEAIAAPIWRRGSGSTATLEITERPIVIPPTTLSLGP
jgi:outer membrane protein OmpA-like peptidoglycan-associated protein